MIDAETAGTLSCARSSLVMPIPIPMPMVIFTEMNEVQAAMFAAPVMLALSYFFFPRELFIITLLIGAFLEQSMWAYSYGHPTCFTDKQIRRLEDFWPHRRIQNTDGSITTITQYFFGPSLFMNMLVAPRHMGL